jgi:hypothetical protein
VVATGVYALLWVVQGSAFAVHGRVAVAQAVAVGVRSSLTQRRRRRGENFLAALDLPCDQK